MRSDAPHPRFSPTPDEAMTAPDAPLPATTDLLRWSTDAVEARNRLDYWVGAICECFLEMEASSPTPGRFGCELLSAPLHGLRVNRVRGSAQDVFRTRAAISRSRENFYYLLCKETTPCNVVQQGAHADRLLPGDLALIDSRQCYELHFPETVDIFSIQLPTQWLETWLPDPRLHLGRRIDGGLGWGLALSAYVRQLSAPTGALPASLVADHLGSLLSLALDRERARQPIGGRDLAARIDEALGSRCTEPDLCANGIAAMLGISVRTLHRALASRQQTFADRLMQHRIRRARRMLESPAFDRVTTAEIGRRVGLLDPSHFVRVCRRLSGCTPQELRARR
jgi:AraC-like DNA-binding protein